ncbi:MAG: TetR/AcrR family transcriptional regulator [Chitinivibrionales bacterium]|nr:TetR/AcrR family transcriptional regulator [Chitinivibrionales bacterium]
MQTKKTVLRQKIIDTAHALFLRFGARRVPIEEICHEADVSKTTFYKYFSDKHALVAAIHDQITAEAFAKYDEINALDIPFVEKIDCMGKWKAEYMGRISADYFTELIDIEHSKEEFKRRYLDNIRAAQKSGDIRHDINPEILWLAVEKLGELFAGEEWRKHLSDLGQLQMQIRTLVWKGLLVRAEEHEEQSGGYVKKEENDDAIS